MSASSPAPPTNVSSIVYPALKFPAKSSSSKRPVPHPIPVFPRELIPDFRPEQAFLRSIRPFLNPRPPGAKPATREEDEQAIREFSWQREDLTVDWSGIFWLTLKGQITNPYITGFATFFLIILYKETTHLARTGISRTFAGVASLLGRLWPASAEESMTTAELLSS